MLKTEKLQQQIYAIENFGALLTDEEFNNLKIKYNYEKEYSAPITPKDILGSIEVFIGEDLIFSTNICSIEYIKSRATRDLIQDIIDNWS